MKTIMIKTKNAVVTLLCAAALAGLWACEADPVETGRGSLPDKEPLENTYAMIRSVYSPTYRAVVNLVENGGAVTDPVRCRLTRPAEKAVTVKAASDEALVKEYNEKYGTEFLTMPDANVLLAGNGTFTVEAGKQVSDKIQITFKGDGLAPGSYLAPITITSSGDVTAAEEGTLYYAVKVRGLQKGNYELDPENTTVFYVNTSTYSPLLADVWIVQKTDVYAPNMPTLWERTYGNIVNLRTVQLGYEAETGRAELVLNSDMRYVLENADKHIRPLQDKGRKVCLCLEGGSTGLGFCNLTDEQIADFTAQVKACVEEYALDGVNFFDRNAGYGMEGTEDMPAVNTTSYPKLIKAMREALGDEKLVTVADYEEPTSYFWDTEATGGIKVGEWVNYVWSGYMSEQEDIQLFDPWNHIVQSEGEENGMTFPVNNHERKAFAGLQPENYGAFAVPFYDMNNEYYQNSIGFMNIAIWRMFGWSTSNILVFGDLITNIQGSYEGMWIDIPGTALMVYELDGMDGGYSVLIDHNPDANVFDPRTSTLYYGDYTKDW